jgi:hypothetical protein
VCGVGLTNAERQKRYRDARKYDQDAPPEERLDLMVDVSARYALRRLALHQDITQKAALEQAIEQAQSQLLDTMTNRQQSKYYKLDEQ